MCHLRLRFGSVATADVGHVALSSVPSRAAAERWRGTSRGTSAWHIWQAVGARSTSCIRTLGSGFLQPSVMGPVGATNSASPNRLRERGQCRCCTIRSSASSGTSWSMSCSHVAAPVSWHSPGSELTRQASSPRPHSRPGSCSQHTDPVSNRTGVPPVHDMCMTVGSSSANHRPVCTADLRH